jgi:plasmid stabilization system protein ParE
VTYTLHRLAENDLDSAFQFYKTKGSGRVALRFLAEFERVADLVVGHPELGTPTRDDRRRYPFHKFPYSIIYRPEAGGVRILVVRHDRQAPAYGHERS